MTKVLVLEPRLFSNQKKGEIIELFNIDNEFDTFQLFGGVYKKVSQ